MHSESCAKCKATADSEESQAVAAKNREREQQATEAKAQVLRLTTQADDARKRASRDLAAGCGRAWGRAWGSTGVCPRWGRRHW